MNSWKSVFALAISLILVVGCGPARPDGIPQLHPATVTVTNGGTPVAGANVLFSGGTSGSWSVSGATNASGVAVIATSQGEWKGNGAPEGTYKVYITKRPEVHQEPLSPELQNDSAAVEKHANEYERLAAAAPKIIPENLTTPTKTPLTLTVSAGSMAELTVDVSEYK